MITKEQKEVIDSILSIFETGAIPSDSSYSTCSILADGAGISYGKHQSTDKSGSLDKIVDLYISKKGTKSDLLKPFVSKLQNNETTTVDRKNPPKWVSELILILKDAGKDPIMHEAQNEIFDINYWIPSTAISEKIGLSTALGYLTIYDTCIHSGPGGVSVIRSKFPEASPLNGGDEKKWVMAYINARRNWLLGNSNPLVQKTVYRMDSLLSLVKNDNWSLVTPMTIRGVKIG